MSKTSQIESILDELVTLPSLPSTLGRIMEMVNDPSVQLGELGKVIARDPSLSLKVLRLVNSAFFGLRDKVTSVERAVVLIGLKPVRNVVLTASVFETLKCGEETLLQHAVACATAGRLLAKHAGAASPFTDPEEAFMYGLLHDAGKIIMQSHLSAAWAKIAPKVSQGKFPAFIIEKKEIGVDHAELGALLAQRWKLQPELVSAIAGHHDLTRCETPAMRQRAAYISVCDWLSYQAGFPALAGAAVPETPGVWEETGFDAGQMAPLVEALAASAESISEMVGIAA
jgi:putative nucleotidyltransferase with HDIG domain